MRVASSPPTATTAWHGLLLVCAAGVVWGTIAPAVQVVHERSGFHVLVINGYRAVAAVAVLLLAAAATGRLETAWSLGRGRWRRVGALGVLTASFQILFFVAVVAAGVSVPTVVALGIAPLVPLALGSLRSRRPPRRRRVATVAAALLGLVLIVLPGGVDHGGDDLWLGVVAAAASGVAYGLSAEVASPLSQRHDALAVTTASTVVAAAVLVPAGLVAGMVGGVAGGDGETTSDPLSWGLVLYLGVFTMALAYLLLYAGLRSTPSGTAVVATLLEPVTAVLIAVLLLGETLSLTAVVGALLIISAIAMLGRQLDDPQPQ